MTFEPRKKKKSDKYANVDPMVLTDRVLDEIKDKFCDIMMEIWTQFQQQYMKMLGSVEGSV